MTISPLWEEFDQEVIRQTEQAAESIAREISHEQGQLKASVHELNEKVDRLGLICRAMHELLCATAGFSDRQLAERITEIDLRDGRADGRVAPTPAKCPQCDSMICKKFNRCLFCGYKDMSGDPFDTV